MKQPFLDINWWFTVYSHSFKMQPPVEAMRWQYAL
jgi:hypothetical protein